MTRHYRICMGVEGPEEKPDPDVGLLASRWARTQPIKNSCASSSPSHVAGSWLDPNRDRLRLHCVIEDVPGIGTFLVSRTTILCRLQLRQPCLESAYLKNIQRLPLAGLTDRARVANREIAQLACSLFSVSWDWARCSTAVNSQGLRPAKTQTWNTGGIAFDDC